MTQGVRIDHAGDVARITLARPDVRNALDPAAIAALTAVFAAIARDATTRVVILQGDGSHFCAGADLVWMRASAQLDEAENLAEARALGTLFETIDACPKPVIGRIHGAAIGGGAGLAAVCDVVVAAENTAFGFSEVRLGLIPAVIAPFVVAKIGLSHARVLFGSGARFGAARAAEIGLVHEVTAESALDDAVERWIAAYRASGPEAITSVKRLLSRLAAGGFEAGERAEFTAAAIARRRVSAEGQAGVAAFLERKPTPWAS